MTSNNNFKAITELDLDAIKVKLMHKESGEGWSLEKANAMEFEYRRFLILMKQYPTEQTAPLFDVDIFWHYHILDTLKYAVDCEAIFGYFLHHFPYVGLRGEADEEVHQRHGDRMKELYEATFGEAYIRDTAEDKAAFSTRVALDGAPQTAFSTRVAADAKPLTAFSTRVAADAKPQTAFSTRVAADAKPQTAFSTRVAADAKPQTAFSTRVAADAKPQTAFSTRVAADAKPQTAFSTRVAVDAAAQEARASFYTNRPTLPASN
ncbi:glycine-rich domain-containing protein [Janthinobacterium fluminis]|uniref:Glycine-rich domain-containing protein-like n=1 Tax=Janthinobacterium fluminis TaxID=2987524 RepID=A0ABT5JY68_9BURK|nr:glycine-rich domain-containing protein-like [Janthinobacterium fluminis]MDC8757380.1 glycine-rich domain-containing protein-like [Janthinobacterium fluminis]